MTPVRLEPAASRFPVKGSTTKPLCSQIIEYHNGSLSIFQVKLVGLEDFADKVVNFFKESIERSYPNRDKMKQLSFTEEGDLTQDFTGLQIESLRLQKCCLGLSNKKKKKS